MKIKNVFPFFFSFFLILVYSRVSYGSEKTILLQTTTVPSAADSLNLAAKSTIQDTNKVNALNTLSRQYLNKGEYKDAMLYTTEAKLLAEKIGFPAGIANAYSNTGVILWYQGTYEKALENHFEALEIRKKIGDRQGVGNSYNNLGLVYLHLGDYEKGVLCYLKALKIREEMGDKSGMGNSYNNMGVIYNRQNKFDKALENYEKALKIREEIGDKFGIGMSYNNVGLIYLEKADYPKAEENLLKGLKMREEIGDKKGTADSYLNVGNVYYSQENYYKALDFYLKALAISQQIGSKRGEGATLNNIGACYLKQNQFEKAEGYLTQALRILGTIQDRDGMKDSYFSLSDLYNRKKDFKKAFEYQRLYSEIKDTLFNEQSSKQMTEMNTKYETEKKDKELIKKDAEIAQKQAESEIQVIVRNTFIMGFVFVLALTFFIYRGYRQKQKANKLLDEKNEKITDSINYAKRIQDSILPPIEQIKKHLPQSFVFHQPKDIVSGDFYWFSEADTTNSGKEVASIPEGKQSLNKLLHPVLLAAIDCTGHGVPGAFMSMMAYNLLEQVVKKNHVYQPALILNELSKLLVEALRQNEDAGKVNDGMDIALIKLSLSEPPSESTNLHYNQLEYAGAHNSLYLIRNGKLQETKANKAAIGFSLNQSFCFTNHNIQLEKGDCIYIFTDGFVDQFGGPTNEKFYYQPFRDLLVEIHQLSMEEQKQKLQTVFKNWKGNKSQMDDVLIMGLRV
jgi:tetratricopeptide (TPR) repeat protein